MLRGPWGLQYDVALLGGTLICTPLALPGSGFASNAQWINARKFKIREDQLRLI